MDRQTCVCVVGLGYVGLPLAVEMSRHFAVVGFDINQERVNILRGGHDPNGEVDDAVLREAGLEVTADPAQIARADVVIVAVPTPVDEHKRPDLSPVLRASDTVGRNLKKGAVVVFESTVYPGATEEECVPVLERASGKRWKEDFFVGYSPERINPGDRDHTFSRITKVVAGDCERTRERLATVYGAAVSAGVYRAESIRVAEAAKVIENTQRDINIALMNELRVIFDRMGISTAAVLAAARTKWNFLSFEPGLVGGHCIGVDPYYLAHKAESVGHHPELILAGRRINDSMGRYFAGQVVKAMARATVYTPGARVLVLGITFKENVPDIRNSKVVDVVAELAEFGLAVDVHDPVADRSEVESEYGIRLVDTPQQGDYQAVVVAVKHRAFDEVHGTRPEQWCAPGGIVYRVRSV